MGKMKALAWLALIGFVIYAFIMWFIENPENAGATAAGLASAINSAKEALGIFFSELFK